MTSRPTPVRVAFLLMLAVAVAYLVDAAALIAWSGDFPDRVREALEASDVDIRSYGMVEGFATALPYVTAAVTVVTAAVLAILAFTVRGGSQTGRILTWVAIGLTLLCNLCGAPAGTPGISGVAYVSAFSRDSAGTHTFQQRLQEGYPDIYRYGSAGIAILSIIALIIVAVLLAQRSANDYFRPPRGRAPYDPGGPYGPGAPARPGAPGVPPAPPPAA
jgi:hypothetical protein